MKVRNGFVSNSSSSSFIVRDISEFTDPKGKNKLSEETIKKLKKYGFRTTHIAHPSHLENSDEKDPNLWKPIKEKGRIVERNFGYSVTCNEYDVIEFLLKNDIGFLACGHYGHFTYLYHRGDKNIMVFRNFGNEVETYCQDDDWKKIVERLEILEKEPYKQISKKQFLTGRA